MINISLFFTFLMASLGVAAQADSSGVYLCASDFQAHRLAFASVCHNHRNAVRFCERPFVIVRYGGQRYKYKKQDVFGFRDCSGDDFRIYLNEKYHVLTRENIFLYEVTEDVGFSEMILYETSYFFSEKLDSHIYPLTRLYLDWVFRKNRAFVKGIRLYFRRDADLTDYDVKTKQYELISLYRQSMGLEP